MESTKIREILIKYLKGKTSPQEENAVDNWYQRLDDEAPGTLSSRQENKLREDIWESIQPAVTNKPAIIKKMQFHNQVRIAASILLISAVGIYMWRTYSQPVASPVAAVTYTDISTKTGERKQVNLPDGSQLTLNSGSSIRIQNDFSKKRCVTIIDGEVYFDVKHDATKAFIIKSGALTTQVLGTSFNIRAYKQLNSMSVGVTRGKVGVNVVGKPVNFLVKGQQLFYTKNTSAIKLGALDDKVLAWQKSELVLADASFDEMTVLIQKNYGVYVVASSKSVTLKHFTATLNTQMPVVKALEVLAAIHQFKIKQRRDTIEILR
ncbi:FecR family protein [Mucilaginibacter pineti]|uniref:FecR family protein n=1 Tax=Mucilaginibacter pineti TaxID=1391627 RepID=A0A1G6ZUH8_9SPHI|nr:FecR family protein [Mucilaginibacter pineti]SDE06170.1 FecR family protein [Mucilaginibacter pineti]